MKRMFMALIIVLSCVGAASAGWFKADVAPTQLRCEYLENPLGIEVGSGKYDFQADS